MTRIIFILTLVFGILTIKSSGQSKVAIPKPGVYGSYADVSTYTELILLDNNTFSYIDRFELGSTFKYNGKWRVKGKYIELYDCENNEMRPMPIKWVIKENELCGKTKRKNNICLTWRKND